MFVAYREVWLALGYAVSLKAMKEGLAMPWDDNDAQRHTKKARSPGAKRQWSAVANKVRDEKMAAGVPESEAAASAVRIANGAVRKRARKITPSSL